MHIFYKDKELEIWNIVNKGGYMLMKVKKTDKGKEMVLKEEDEWIEKDRSKNQKNHMALNIYVYAVDSSELNSLSLQDC